MPPPVRRKLPLACLSLLALAFALAGTALAGNGGIAPPAETPQAGRIQDLYWILLGISGVIFVIVEGALARLRHPVPQPRAAARTRGPADPRPHAARADLDRDPGPDPRRDHRPRLLQAARDQGRARRDRCRAEDDRARRGPPVLLALHVSERRGLGERAPAAGRAARSTSRSPLPRTTSPTAGGFLRSPGRWTRSRAR